MTVIPFLICVCAVIGSAHTRSSGSSDSYHLQELLEYTCTHMSAIDHLKYFFPDDLSSTLSNLETFIQPICNYIHRVADNFNVKKFCKFTTRYVQAMGLFDGRDLVGPAPDPNAPGYKMIQRLYGIDLGDLTRTLCPNAYKLFEPSLFDEFLTSILIFALSDQPSPLDDLDSICEDRQHFYERLGVPNGSPYQKLVDILLDIGSDIAGYESFNSFCEDITLIVSQDDTDRRKSSKKIVLTVRERLLGALGIKIDSTMSTKLKDEL